MTRLAEAIVSDRNMIRCFTDGELAMINGFDDEQLEILRVAINIHAAAPAIESSQPASASAISEFVAFGKALQAPALAGAPVDAPSEPIPGKTVIYADGSCLGNPGLGGWAYVIVSREGEPITVSGSQREATNNQMEVLAAIEALKAMPEGAAIEIVSDSNYLIQTMREGWKTKANHELWAVLKPLAAKRRCTWTWVKGHADNKWNNLADKAARKAAESLR